MTDIDEIEEYQTGPDEDDFEGVHFQSDPTHSLYLHATSVREVPSDLVSTFTVELLEQIPGLPTQNAQKIYNGAENGIAARIHLTRANPSITSRIFLFSRPEHVSVLQAGATGNVYYCPNGYPISVGGDPEIIYTRAPLYAIAVANGAVASAVPSLLSILIEQYQIES